MHSLRQSLRGQSLIEILIAAGIGAIFIIGAASLVSPALNIRTKATSVELGVDSANEMMDSLHALADGNWDTLLLLATGTANRYYVVQTQAPYFTIGSLGSSGTEQISFGSTTVLRYFNINDVYRDASGNATTSGTGTYDPSTKQINVFFRLLSATNFSQSAAATTGTIATYFTRNVNAAYSQGDWSGGSGDTGPNTSTKNTFFAASGTIAYSTYGALTLSTTTASGTLQSPTFDTGNASGSQINSVTWMGAAPAGTSVGFQFAASNASSGPWTTFKGADGTSATWFPNPPNAATSTPIALATGTNYSMFTGFRYFRYQVTLFPDAGHTVVPTVDNININWSP